MSTERVGRNDRDFTNKRTIPLLLALSLSLSHLFLLCDFFLAYESEIERMKDHGIGKRGSLFIGWKKDLVMKR